MVSPETAASPLGSRPAVEAGVTPATDNQNAENHDFMTPGEQRMLLSSKYVNPII